MSSEVYGLGRFISPVASGKSGDVRSGALLRRYSRIFVQSRLLIFVMDSVRFGYLRT